MHVEDPLPPGYVIQNGGHIAGHPTLIGIDIACNIAVLTSKLLDFQCTAFISVIISLSPM